MSIHLWTLFDAPSAGVRALEAALKKSATLYALSAPYGATGGTANFSHAIFTESGTLYKVSEAVLERLPPERRPVTCPALEIDTRALALDVPFAEKDAAKAAGARWHGEARRWCIDPAHREDVRQWLPAQETWISLVPPAEGDLAHFELPAAVRALRMA